MSVPSMEELVEVFDRAYATEKPLSDASFRAGLRAVLDRLKPVVAKACGQAMACAFPEDYQGDKTDEQLLAASQRDHDVAVDIATRIIDRVKGA